MDPEYEAIVLFISTTKWSIKVTSIDRRTPPNTSLTVYIMQFAAYSLRFETRNNTRVHGRMGDFYKEQDSVS